MGPTDRFKICSFLTLRRSLWLGPILQSLLVFSFTCPMDRVKCRNQSLLHFHCHQGSNAAFTCRCFYTQHIDTIRCKESRQESCEGRFSPYRRQLWTESEDIGAHCGGIMWIFTHTRTASAQWADLQGKCGQKSAPTLCHSHCSRVSPPGTPSPLCLSTSRQTHDLTQTAPRIAWKQKLLKSRGRKVSELWACCFCQAAHIWPPFAFLHSCCTEVDSCFKIWVAPSSHQTPQNRQLFQMWSKVLLSWSALSTLCCLPYLRDSLSCSSILNVYLNACRIRMRMRRRGRSKFGRAHRWALTAGKLPNGEAVVTAPLSPWPRLVPCFQPGFLSSKTQYNIQGIELVSHCQCSMQVLSAADLNVAVYKATVLYTEVVSHLLMLCVITSARAY